MATGTPDVEQIPEGNETSEECAGKKKSKFQTFKKFFAKKKRKESPAASKESTLKPSQSSSDVSVPDPANAAFESPTELGAKGSMGNKALSHESVFISEPAPENTNGDRLSQENIAGKVKALQLQLQSNIRVGSPPQVITSKPCDDAGAVSEDDGLPQSPQEISTLHELLTRSSSKTFNLVKHRSSQSLGDTDSEDEQLSSESLSLAFSPLTSSLLPIDFNSPASTLGCLDSSAARHKMALNPRKHRDRIRGAKLMANVPAARQLPRLSEEESSTKQQLIVNLPDLSNEGCMLQKELIGVSRSSEEIDKSDLTTLPQFAIKPSLTVAETVTLPELASKRLSNGTDTTTLPEFTCKSTSEAAEHFEGFKESSVEDIASEKVSISNVLSNTEHTEDEHYVDEENIRAEKTDPCPSCDLQSESELHQQNSVTDDVQTRQNSTEASECLSQTSLPVVSLNDLSERNEPAIVLAVEEGHDYFCKPAEHTESNPLDNVSLPPDVTLTIISAPEAILSIDGTRVHLRPVSSPINNDIIIRESVPSVTPAIKSSTFEAEPPQIPTNEEPQNPSRTSTNLDDYDLNAVSVHQTIAVTHDIIGKTTSESHDKSNPIRMGDLKETKEKNAGACTVAGSGTEKDHVATRCTKVIKTNKVISANLKSPQTTTKPVRFTIAPAWQRSISGGSGTQDDTGGKSPPTANIKPELFEGTAEKHACLGMVRPPAKAVSSNDSSSVNKGAPLTPKKQNENRTEHVEIPFGVRLKKASPLLKNFDDKIRDLQKSDKSETCLVKDLQKFESPGKSLQTVSDDRKPSPMHDDPGEGKGQQNTRAEGVPKKPHSIRTPEKSMSKSVAPASSEPEWISVAKLKQKCFQGHPLAKEQNTTETAVGGSDVGEIQSTVSEEGLRKICVASPVAQGRHLESLVSTITAADIETDSEEKSLPAALEKEPRQTTALPVTQKCPAEPPWLSMAKKKAKAWSDMPQIVQ